jgi:hypothetical protein
MAKLVLGEGKPLKSGQTLDDDDFVSGTNFTTFLSTRKITLFVLGSSIFRVGLYDIF